MGAQHPPTPRALGSVVLLNGGFLGLAAAVAQFADSLAVWSEVVHMLGDMGALAIATAAAALGSRLPVAKPVGGLLNGLVVMGASLWSAAEAVARLYGSEVHPVHGEPILVVSLAAIGINVASAWLLGELSHRDVNLRGVYLHMLADAVGAFGALVASGFVMMGWPEADALASLGIAAAVVAGALPLVRDATLELAAALRRQRRRRRNGERRGLHQGRQPRASLTSLRPGVMLPREPLESLSVRSSAGEGPRKVMS